jgi:hypothetical protein
MPSTLRQPQSDLAEAATALVGLARYDYEPPIRSGSRGGTIPSTGLGDYSPEQARLQATFLRMMSVLEAYVDLRAESELHEQLPPNSLTRTAALLLADHHLAASTNWRSRHDSFLRYHAVTLGDFPDWNRMDTCISIRNAVAHGLGRLTRRQLSDILILEAEVPKVEARIVNGKVELRIETLDSVHQLFRKFISWLELEFMP